MSTPLWQPTLDAIKTSQMHAFMQFVATRYQRSIPDYATLYDWSVEHIAEFWDSVWDFCGVQAKTKGSCIVENLASIEQAGFFPEAQLNYAENLLKRCDDHEAIVFLTENGQKQRLSFAALHQEVAQFAAALKAEGVSVGDRVAGFVPNTPEAIIAMLATASLGAVWSSCSPDFGAQGALDRFLQIEPKILLAADSYLYNGKPFDCLQKIADIQRAMPSLRKTIVFSFLTSNAELSEKISALDCTIDWHSFVEPYKNSTLSFTQVPFSHPLVIMFSSGTTGKPKCIVHGVGGTLLQHLKEHQLHCDIKRDDRVFYFTTCGWMMWNWQVSALASGATLLLFDGSPFHPSGELLWNYAQDERITLFGTSAKYIDALAKANISVEKSHDLSALRMITSTGSPLVPESFDYVYQHIKQDVCLASISGGTDIISCFALGNPIAAVYRGELQTRGLGMAVAVFDDQGHAVTQKKGELVCTKAFPSRPVGFWNDADGSRYHNAYFSRYPEIWHHGDYVELTAHQGLVIYGRSDAVLNPGGVRIGTAEIYRQVEQIDEILESIVVGQDWQDDVRVILFVVLRPGVTLTQALKDKIKQMIKTQASPRHVPAKIIQVAEIPRTRNGKLVELAVRAVIHGQPIQNITALANPEALEAFKHIEELHSP